jgi:hypothetical protein
LIYVIDSSQESAGIVKTVSDPSLGSEAHQWHRQARHCIDCIAIYGRHRASIAINPA